MSLLFVHNIKLKKDDVGNLYTHSSYNTEVWNRYLNLFNSITVVVRKESKIYTENTAKKSFEIFDNKVLNYTEINDIYKSIFTYINPIIRLKNNKIIKEAVKSHDYIIARIPSYAGYNAIKYAKKFKKPYLVEVVACSWDGLWNHSIRGKLLAPFSFFKQKKYVLNSPYVVYVTNNFLQNRYPTNGKSVACSNVVLNDINNNILYNRLNKINNMRNGQKIIIGTTAAVDVKYKGQQYVIKALGKLKRRGIVNLEYQLVGGGNQNYLKRIAYKYDVYEQVKFLGALPHDKVFEWLNTIDIYVQPSRQEGLPRALIEAMSRGLPAFGAKTGGIPELLDSEFIISNTRKNIKEICDILLRFKKEIMIEQATRNFSKSKNYLKSLIDERRRNFITDFKIIMKNTK